MPRYDYKCPRCGITFESIQSTETAWLPCTECYVNFSMIVGANRQLSYPASIQIH